MRTFVFLLTPLLILALQIPASAARGTIHRRARHYVSTAKYVYTSPVSLLESETLEGWSRVDKKPVTDGWEVVDGTLHRKAKAGDIMTDKEYENFVLDFEWTIAKGGNSGVKYKFDKYNVGGWLGCEYQVLDDKNSAEGKRTKHEAGSLYDIIPPSRFVLRKHDQVNKGRIMVMNDRIRHYLNGVKVVDIRVGSKDWEKRLAESKFKDTPDFGAISGGRLMVQDHGDEVWFHKMVVREIVPVSTWYKQRREAAVKVEVTPCETAENMPAVAPCEVAKTCEVDPCEPVCGTSSTKARSCLKGRFQSRHQNSCEPCSNACEPACEPTCTTTSCKSPKARGCLQGLFQGRNCLQGNQCDPCGMSYASACEPGCDMGCNENSCRSLRGRGLLQGLFQGRGCLQGNACDPCGMSACEPDCGMNCEMNGNPCETFRGRGCLQGLFQGGNCFQAMNCRPYCPPCNTNYGAAAYGQYGQYPQSSYATPCQQYAQPYATQQYAQPYAYPSYPYTQAYGAQQYYYGFDGRNYYQGHGQPYGYQMATPYATGY